jgi:hypothetical protein
LGFAYRKKPTPDLVKAREYYDQALEKWPENCGAMGYKVTILSPQLFNTAAGQATATGPAPPPPAKYLRYLSPSLVRRLLSPSPGYHRKPHAAHRVTLTPSLTLSPLPCPMATATNQG